MPFSRAVLLLRRLSAGDSKLKNINQNTRETPYLAQHPACVHRDFGILKRSSIFQQRGTHQQIRNLSDNIKMSSSSTDVTEKLHKHTNRLFKEKSPYLLQHAHNPVDWYPWCQEAFDKAKKENKLIFLSVGYSTCHWCHVMEKDSFENEEVAKVMNEHYINIKVDREERPDIDRVYMLFVMATTGGGGWPMSVFLTPELRPVTGGTYFPPEDRWGRPGFKTILLSLAKKWSLNREQFLEAGVNIIEAMEKISLANSEKVAIPGEAAWNQCVQRYTAIYEPEFGGFGLAPKFPQASIFNFLFHFYARDKTNPKGKKCLDMCLHTLIKIAKGGIHDHVSSGFARYSVDNDWHVPHFEKMLYDQAQLTVAYTDAYLATKNEFFAEVARDIIKYVNRDLRHALGGFYSAEDADSYPTFGADHKKEGAFCVWEYDELKNLLEGKTINNVPYLDIFCDYFSVEEDGNIGPDSDPHNELTNKNVLIIYGSNEETAKKFDLTIDQFSKVITECIDILFEARQKRPRPHLDTKMLCSWNGLMISGLARAGQGLGDKEYVEDAIKTAEFIKKYLYDESSKTLLHSCYRGEDGAVAQTEQPIKGFLDDYAFLIKGLLDLYEATLDPRWLNWARELQLSQNEQFWDSKDGGYYTCSADDESVIIRLKEEQDGAEPSGNSVACHNLQRLAALADKCGREHDLARDILTAFAKRLTESPAALPEMMSALMFYTDSPTQVVISGCADDPRTLALAGAVRARLLPARVLALREPRGASGADTPWSGGAPSASVCRRCSCSLPVRDARRLGRLLDEPPANTN